MLSIPISSFFIVPDMYASMSALSCVFVLQMALVVCIKAVRYVFERVDCVFCARAAVPVGVVCGISGYTQGKQVTINGIFSQSIWVLR